jgi:hypothetical protein
LRRTQNSTSACICILIASLQRKYSSTALEKKRGDSEELGVTELLT